MKSLASGPVQDRMQGRLEELVRGGIELGVQLTAYHKGRLIVDAWAGTMHPDRPDAVDGQTLFPVFSTGKGVASTAVHVLVERGVLAYDTPIAHYWPAFAANGKSDITLRHALNHTAGLPQMPDLTDPHTVCEWNRMCDEIAKLTPIWAPGFKTYYHAITFSWLLGETARRADGRDFATIVRDEVCRPLGMDSFYFGIPDAVEPRVATLEAQPPARETRVLEATALEPTATPAPTAPPPAPDPVGGRSIPPYVQPLEAFMNKPDIRRACIPASNAIATARSVARHYLGLDAAMQSRSAAGKPILSAATLRQAIEWSRPTGPELGGTFGLGYGLKGPADNPSSAFGHNGYGGSKGYLDVRRGLAIGLTRNRTTAPDTNLVALLDELAALTDKM